MKMRIRLVIAGFLVLSIGLTIFIFAQKGRSQDPYLRAAEPKETFVLGAIERMKREGSLTDAQIDAVGPFVEQYYDKVQRIVQEKPDRATAIYQMRQLSDELERQLSQILSPDQMDALKSRQESRRAGVQLAVNDAGAKTRLFSIARILERYAAENGKYPLDLDSAVTFESGNPCGQAISGFVYSCHFSESGYRIRATPVAVGTTGTRTYTIETGGVLSPADKQPGSGRFPIFGVVVAMFIAAGYVGQAHKAVVAGALRLSSELEKGQITQEQYNDQMKENTFGKTLLSPRKVFSSIKRLRGFI